MLPRVAVLLCWFGCPSPAEPLPPPVDFEARRLAIDEQLCGLVEDLEAAGRYDCCIETPCKHCARLAGGCMCGEGLRRGEPVCEECALMWTKGLGAEPGVDPGSVRSFLEAQRRMEGEGE